jgi:hypothetical protein
LKDSSDNKILSNQIFVMLQRLEKAVSNSDKLHFNDFVKFVCKPETKYAIKNDEKKVKK